MFNLKVLALAILCTPVLYGQGTVLAIPGPDVAGPGHIYTRVDNTYNPISQNYSSTPNFMFGIGAGTELNLNFNTLSYPFTQVLAIESGFKSSHQVIDSVTPDNKYHNGLIIYGGAKFVNAIANSPTNFSEFTYTATSLVYYKNRFTSGIWNSQNYIDKSNRSGAMLGYEYFATPNIVPAIDWSSGNGTNGYTTVGVMLYKARWMIIPGYQIGNSGVKQGNHQAVLYVGFTIK